jgi:hypothetical protein
MHYGTHLRIAIVRHGDIIQIPSGGTCELTQVVSVNARVWIRGESRDTSVITLTATNWTQSTGGGRGVLDINLSASGTLVSNLTIRTNGYAGNGCINNNSDKLVVSDCNVEFKFQDAPIPTQLGIVSSRGYLCVRGCTFTCQTSSTANRRSDILTMLRGAARSVIVQDNVFTDDLPASDTSPVVKALTFNQVSATTGLQLQYMLVKGNVAKVNGTRRPSSVEFKMTDILPIQLNPFVDM